MTDGIVNRHSELMQGVEKVWNNNFIFYHKNMYHKCHCFVVDYIRLTLIRKRYVLNVICVVLLTLIPTELPNTNY